MADTKTVTLTNTQPGMRGFWDGPNLHMLEPKASVDAILSAADLKAAEGTGYFEITGGDDPEPGPLDHSVADLTEYLAGVDDADEVEKLLDAEKAGKSRAGAIKVLEARRDELLAS